MKALIGRTALVCALAVGPVALASTQERPATTPGSTGTSQDSSATKQTTSVDSAFMRAAAMGGMAEVEHGKLAAQNAASSDVKLYGQRMADDHGKANAELMSIASQKNVTLPTELEGKHKAMQDKLAKMSGAAFDNAYTAHMVNSHKETVALFQREAKSGKDPETKAFAEKTLPIVQEHLKMAQDLSAKNRTR